MKAWVHAVCEGSVGSEPFAFQNRSFQMFPSPSCLQTNRLHLSFVLLPLAQQFYETLWAQPAIVTDDERWSCPENCVCPSVCSPKIYKTAKLNRVHFRGAESSS